MSQTQKDVPDRGQIEVTNDHTALKLLDTMPVLVWRCRADGLAEFVNQPWCDFTAQSAEEAQGQGWARAVHPDDRERVLAQWQQTVSAVVPFATELRYRRADGKYLWFLLRARPVFDEQGAVAWWWAASTDIEPQKRVEENLAVRGQAIFDTAVEGFVTIDENGIIDSFNNAAEKIFGYRADEVIGKNVSMLMPEPDRSRHDGYIHNYLTTGQAKIIGIGREVLGQRKDGSIFPLDLAVSEVHVAGKRLFTGIIRDITERKKAEERLLHSERLAAMGQMVSAIAHESRNALQRIQACVDMLRLDLEHNVEALEELQGIERASDSMRRLLEDLRGYAAPLKLERTGWDVAHIWRQAWSNLAGLRKDRDCKLHEQIDGVDLECEVDAFRIEQVFRNLFENSLAACKDPVRIVISAQEVVQKGRAAVRISVRDNGPGLSEEQKQKIFAPFFTTRTKGTGLGMPIARRIVETHQGTLEVGETKAGGAELLLTLPRRA